ncbi:MAG: DinB family protein [Saprospiraceae bacterium]|nr:DinB family protein [Saprospiraceae bacterium]
MYTHIFQQLERHGNVFKSLLEGLTPDEYLWKQGPEKWCLLEILCHLCDEEREDFRARLRHVLEHPEQALPPIDPVGWVTERQYIGQNYEAKLAQFVAERQASVAWLHTLSEPKWDNAYLHPKFGTMSGHMFLANWLAHDYLHIRQITRLKYDYLRSISGETLTYAGAW